MISLSYNSQIILHLLNSMLYLLEPTYIPLFQSYILKDKIFKNKNQYFYTFMSKNLSNNDIERLANITKNFGTKIISPFLMFDFVVKSMTSFKDDLKKCVL
jgi:hypothetical protein